jgi:hypothetical protein
MTDDNILQFKPRPYRTPQSTVEAFWFLVQLNDPDRLKSWLQAHPRDQKTLIDLYERQQDASA